MQLRKNQIIPLEINNLTNEGNGIGRYGGIAVFVPYTAVGDVINCRIVKVNKTYAYGIISEITAPSPDRIMPDCNVFGKCGGCCFRHLKYGAELKAKELFVKDAFIRIGKLEPVFLPIIASSTTEKYRNKAQYPVGEVNGDVFYGFYANRSHRIIKNNTCNLQPDIFTEICDCIINYVRNNKIPIYDEISHDGVLRHIYIRKGHYSDEICVCLVVKEAGNEWDKLPSELLPLFGDIKSVIININRLKTNVILGEKNIVLYGDEHIRDTMCGNEVIISPHSFYQVNTPTAEVMYSVVCGFADACKDTAVFDVYSGIGTIGMALARSAGKVVCIEIVKAAVENAKINAEINKIKNIEFVCSDAVSLNNTIAGIGFTPDVIVLDPPRGGCSKDLLHDIASTEVKKIVMVSCNPSTAARDCKILCDLGFLTETVQPVDMFPRTNHVECVVLLSKAG